MQRVRIGLTGLALVFLLVLLGAVIRSAGDNEPMPDNALMRELSSGGQINEQAEPSEPLAELGVAPGSTEAANSAAGTGSPSGK